MMKTFLSGVFGVVILLLTMSGALAAEPVITPIDTITFTEGMQSTFQVRATDADNDRLQYELFRVDGLPAGMTINANTGLITWTPGEDQGNVQTMFVRVYEVDANGNRLNGVPAVEEFDATVLPVLDIISMKVGKVGGALATYADGATTAPFKPGDELRFELTLKNRFTTDHHEIISRDDVSPTIEDIEVRTFANHADLTDFPVDLNQFTDDPLFLAAQGEKVVAFTYQLPYDIAQGENYALNFKVRGEDQDVRPHSFDSTRAINLKVQKSAHEVKIRSAAFSDSDLTCQEKQQPVELSVILVNIGLADEELTIEVTNRNQVIGSGSFILKMEENVADDDQVGIVVDLDARNAVGQESASIRVFRTAVPAQVYDTKTVTLTAANCAVSLRNPLPATNQVTISRNALKTFSIEVVNPENVQSTKWFRVINGQDIDQNDNDLSYDFNAPAIYDANGVGPHTLKFVATANGQPLTQQWTITIADRPTSTNFQMTNLQGMTPLQLSNVPNFFLENAQGKIQFTQLVDLSNIFDLDNLVKINQGLVAIDSANAPALNKPATITLKGLNIQNPIIKTSAAFTATAAQVTDVCNTCRLVSPGAQVVFEVMGFSTYTVSSSTPTQIEVPAKVEFPLSDREVSVQTTFDIKNPGTTNSLTNVRITSNAVARYEVTFTPNTIAELRPGATATVQVSAKVPKDQDSGLVDIGDITVAAEGLPSKTIAAFFTNAKSGLEVTDVTVNGRTENKLQPGEENEIEAVVKNILGVKIEDITVKVTVKDIDEEDLDATSEEFDLNSGRTNEKGAAVLLPFNLDKETYTVEIEVTGTDTNGADHLTKTTRQIDVERRTHQLVLNKVDLPSSLSCNLNPVLTVEIKNIGKSDEEDVTLKVTSRTLNIQEERAGLEVDKYSSSDNDKSLSFNLNLAEAPTGTHLVNVDVYRDDELEDSKELSVTITPCSGVQQGGATTTTYTPPEEFLQQLQQAAQATAPETSVKSSFRESESYLILLAMLVFLTFFAVLLGAVTMMVKRKKK